MSDQPLLALNVDLAGHDASRPLLPPADYPLSIKEIKVEENKDKTGRNLVVSFATTQPATSVTGKPIPVGQVLTNYYPLQASEKQIEKGTPDAWKDRIALLIDAALQTDETTRPNLNGEVAAAMYGKVVLGSVSIEKTEQYGEQNRLGQLKPLA